VGSGELVVNGRPHDIAGLATIGDLLQQLKVVPGRVVVELNGTIHRRGEGLDEEIRPGDVVEIVHFVGGG
jgi:thiamine biosynthesis protein ThiS